MRERAERACGGRGRAVVLIAIFLLGLGLRLDYAIRAPHDPVDDARAYARISRALAEGEGYTQGRDFEYLQSASNYQPGLPLFVTGIYEVRGGVDEETARIVLALLSSAAIVFAFLIGRRLAGPNAGLIAAAATAAYPALLEYTGMLMTEPVGTALLSGMLLLYLRAREGTRAWPWAATGVAIGALAMLRPEYLLFVAVLPVLAVLPWRGESWRAAAPGTGGADGRLRPPRGAAVDGPQLRRLRPRGADLDRWRPGPLRGELPARRAATPKRSPPTCSPSTRGSAASSARCRGRSTAARPSPPSPTVATRARTPTRR